MLVPLYGFLKGDTLGLIVLVHDHQPVADIATSLIQAAAPRVAGPERAAVFHRGVRLDPDAPIASTPIEPLDRVDVVPELDHAPGGR